MEKRGTNVAGIYDELAVTVNGAPNVEGPDPEVWGADHCVAPNGAEPVDDRENVEGPDPAVWGAAE